MRARGTCFLGLLACLCFGCPGAEPSATSGFGGAGGNGVPTTSTGGQDNGGAGGATLTGPSAGGMGAGGMGSGGMGGCEADLESDVDNCGECGRVCLHDESVKLPRCLDGVCQSFCESGFVNIATPATGPDDGCEADGRRVFVTEDLMTAAEVGGVIGADTLCQNLAEEEALGGAWKAWLSEGAATSSPSARFSTLPPAPYMLLDFTVVADSWAVLVGSNVVVLDHPIDLSETMTPVPSEFENVWTGTTALGLPSGSDCSLWTAAGTDEEATVGNLSQLTAEWTEAETLSPCDGVARLYCFEQ